MKKHPSYAIARQPGILPLPMASKESKISDLIGQIIIQCVPLSERIPAGSNGLFLLSEALKKAGMFSSSSHDDTVNVLDSWLTLAIREYGLALKNTQLSRANELYRMIHHLSFNLCCLKPGYFNPLLIPQPPPHYLGYDLMTYIFCCPDAPIPLLERERLLAILAEKDRVYFTSGTPELKQKQQKSADEGLFSIDEREPDQIAREGTHCKHIRYLCDLASDYGYQERDGVMRLMGSPILHPSARNGEPSVGFCRSTGFTREYWIRHEHQIRKQLYKTLYHFDRQPDYTLTDCRKKARLYRALLHWISGLMLVGSVYEIVYRVNGIDELFPAALLRRLGVYHPRFPVVMDELRHACLRHPHRDYQGFEVNLLRSLKSRGHRVNADASYPLNDSQQRCIQIFNSQLRVAMFRARLSTAPRQPEIDRALAGKIPTVVTQILFDYDSPEPEDVDWRESPVALGRASLYGS